MKTVSIFTICVIAMLSSIVFFSETQSKKQTQNYDAGYVVQPNADCWQEPSGCQARSMYPAGY